MLSEEWVEDGKCWRYGDTVAERASDDNAFVITGFGSDPNIETAFSAVQAAMRFGKIRIRVTPDSRSIIDQLRKSGRIKRAPTIGTEHEELGVMGIKR